jgi:hypothetical protein
MNNACMIGEKLAGMDNNLKRIGEKNLSQLKFDYLINKFPSKYDFYKLIEEKTLKVLSRDSQKID